jgi:hypothetical protein
MDILFLLLIPACFAAWFAYTVFVSGILAGKGRCYYRGLLLWAGVYPVYAASAVLILSRPFSNSSPIDEIAWLTAIVVIPSVVTAWLLGRFTSSRWCAAAPLVGALLALTVFEIDKQYMAWLEVGVLPAEKIIVAPSAWNAVVMTMMFGWSIRAVWIRRRARTGFCFCGYSREGLGDRPCPECGRRASSSMSTIAASVLGAPSAPPR